jgi:hypothetical protein
MNIERELLTRISDFLITPVSNMKLFYIWSEILKSKFIASVSAVTLIREYLDWSLDF